MKFRDPRTKEVIDLESEVRDRLCTKVECDFCPLRSKRNGTNMGCNELIAKFPEKAAALMGYEVVEDHVGEEDTFFQFLKDSLEEAVAYKEGRPNHCRVTTVEVEETDMGKTLKDWTFGEAQEYCKKQRSTAKRCSTCKIQKFCDKYLGRKGDAASPKYWDLSEKPIFTRQEVEDAKTLLRIFPEQLDSVSRANDGTVTLKAKGAWRGYLNSNAFPSLKPGEAITIKEICGETD